MRYRAFGKATAACGKGGKGEHGQKSRNRQAREKGVVSFEVGGKK